MRIRYWYLLLGPALMFALGFSMNALVMAANHGQMPVLWPGGCPDVTDESAFPIHACMTAVSHLKWMADWVVIRGLGVASIGDFFEWAGEASMMPALFMWFGRTLIKKHD